MFTVGTDTEFFLQTEEGKLVSAIRFIKGGKRDPVALQSGGNVTYDNVAMEFATPIANDEESFVNAVKNTMLEALGHLPEGIGLNHKPSVDFPAAELEHEEAKKFGCDPDFDAWELMMNEVPPEAELLPFRSVGGHLHVGYVEDSGNEFLKDPMGKVTLVKAFDLVLGIPLTIMDNNKDTVNRRQLYGKAGCHRPTEYGVEYRALSNFWIFSPSLVRVVYALADEAMRLVREDQVDGLVDRISSDEIQRVVNEGDSETAVRLWQEVISPVLSAGVVDKFNTISSKKEFNIYKEWGL
jgi:hypothetical protein